MEKITLVEQKRIEDCEWVFQFDDDEPQIFAWTDNDMNSDEEPTVTFTISNTENAYISFTNKTSGKTFKLFAREITDEGKAMRAEQTSKLKFKTDLENGSENKETQS
jgi:hypothetical protein